MKKFLVVLFVALVCAQPYMARGAVKSAVELRQIAQAGGSLIIELANSGYSMAELLQIAQSLAAGATLTLKIDRAGRYSTAQLLQIVKARPGKITIWLEN